MSMAKSASATDMIPLSPDEPPVHGGDLGGARRLFPAAPEPFVDLSTGINPQAYPMPALPAEAFARLPEPAAFAALAAVAAEAYGAPSPAGVVAAPGTQILLPLVAGLAPTPGRAAIVVPTYSEHARAAALAGHDVFDITEPAAGADADLVVVTNPNNPDGRLRTPQELMRIAEHLREQDGLLVVDEAFMDVAPQAMSLAPHVGCGNIVVLRSFGKFFGLAGVRLGFALTAPPLAARLAALLGPWAVSGPALAVGAMALADRAWIERTRLRLAEEAQRLDTMLAGTGLDPVGGTALFRLVRTNRAADLFNHLGRAGILIRVFPEKPDRARFGLPGDADAWLRLERALGAFAAA